MSKTLINIDDEALALAMAHYGTTVKREAINRALREVAERRLRETDDLEDWIIRVGGRLAEADLRQAWRQ
jgi:Arc/MetJ family transcription regulator